MPCDDRERVGGDAARALPTRTLSNGDTAMTNRYLAAIVQLSSRDLRDFED